MTTDTHLETARTAFARHEWTAAAQAFAAADEASPLGSADLDMAGLARHLIGDDDAAVAILARAHQAALASGETLHAARVAFWLGMMSADRGDVAVAGGWLSRASRLVEESGTDSVEAGYLLIPQALRSFNEGDSATAFGLYEQAAEVADRFHEADLATIARVGRGESLIALGEIERGVALLDDSMLALTSGEVGPVWTGIVYCASIEAFHRIYDLRRAQGWTEALTRWCAEQPDLAPFRGRCLVYRADLMRFHGAWLEAAEEVRRAEEWLLRPPPAPAVGEAYYVEAELLRLRGELDAAEAAYREASRWGRRQEPGLALLRLAQGRGPAALTMIRRAIDESSNELDRTPLLEALVEISIAGGDVDGARAAADDLARVASLADTPFLHAIAAVADGSARLAAGDPSSALATFRRAFNLWRAIDAPYELARVRVGIGLACRALGDEETAAMEFSAARDAFEGLGAAPDVRQVDAITGAAPPMPGGLSPREAEILRHLAGGGTNRQIAETLGISERTVDRHVSNIYTKLDVSSRAAATSFAHEHHLV
jgi:DNA-binding CsgD family transcriptional regulator/tetratricopeptide (TPR) repeat protein